jgi:hypothetical protein
MNEAWSDAVVFSGSIFFWSPYFALVSLIHDARDVG